jgi:serine/threonine protein phosphatase PrpC
VLRGRDHAELGRVAVLAEGTAALALSRGGADKPYAYWDPNEDCAGFALGEGGVLVAVADAHKGCDASQIVVEGLLEHFGPDWTAARRADTGWPELAARAAAELHGEVLRRGAEGGNPDSRTTFSFALVRPGDDLLAWGCVGDSHAFVVDADAAEEVAVGPDPPSWFVGATQREPGAMGARLRAGAEAIGTRRALVLVTDGISEKHIGVEDPAAAVAEAARGAADAKPELRALETARGIVERAQQAHRAQKAGDNVAAAVVWLA